MTAVNKLAIRIVMELNIIDIRIKYSKAHEWIRLKINVYHAVSVKKNPVIFSILI